MNKILTTSCTALAMMFAVNAHAEFTGNLGWTSEYIFRGISQSDSSAYVGADYEKGGFYVGTWAADVSQGAEVDFYFGYGGELSEKISYGVGATGYFYTDDFDDTYKELNFSLRHSLFSIDANFGQYENFGGPTQDYSIYTVTANHNDLYALVGSHGGDFDGEYFEVGYGFEAEGMDFSVSVIHGTSTLLGESDTSIVFSIGKSLDLKQLGLVN